MAGLLQKLRVAVLAAAHSLVDKVIDMNSAEAVRQHIRDLEDALEQLRSEVAVASGNVKTLKRTGENLRGKMEGLNHSADLILSDANPDNDHLALGLEAQIKNLEEELTATNSEMDAASKAENGLRNALTTLNTRHTTMTGQLNRLAMLERTAVAKEKAAAALAQARGLTATGADVSVDDVASRIQRRADVADARLEQEVGAMNEGGGDDIATAELKDRIAKRKAALAAKSTASPLTAAVSG